MTSASETILDQLGNDQHKAYAGVALSLSLLEALVKDYRASVLANGRDWKSRVKKGQDLLACVMGLTGSEAQLALLIEYQERDEAGEYDDSEEQEAEKAVVAAAAHVSDLRAVRGVREETVECALVELDAAVLDLDDFDLPDTQIDLTPNF